MNITVFGATGHVGKSVIALGLASGHYMTAFGRNVDDLIDKEARDDHFKAVKGYVFDAAEVRHAVKGADAVISVLGGSFDGTDKTRSLGIKNITEQMEAAGVKRIVALGGMGVLDGTDGDYLINAPDYPEEYKPVGMEHLQAFLYLKNSTLNWTFVCAPDIMNTAGDGNYITRIESMPEPNAFKIAAGDLARFMLSAIPINEYFYHRVGISAK